MIALQRKGDRFISYEMPLLGYTVPYAISKEKRGQIYFPDSLDKINLSIFVKHGMLCWHFY
jgi:hypothetical protein